MNYDFKTFLVEFVIVFLMIFLYIHNLKLSMHTTFELYCRLSNIRGYMLIKCNFWVTFDAFIGNVITSEGIKVDG